MDVLLALRNAPIKSLESEHAKDIERKREKRSEAARVFIPEPKDINRREACLADPERYLRTYFSRIFYNPFATHHKRMIQAIYDRAFTGGDKAVAAPRGDGKTQVTIGMASFCLHATPIRFPVLIGATSKKGRKLFGQLKSKYHNGLKFPEFYEDFPEVTHCVKALQGAPQRAAKQHVDGELTRIEWTQELIVFPTVKCEWDKFGIGGKRVVYFGLDSAIRGEGFEEDRPDMAIVDDPETREVAFSPTAKYEDVEAMIDGDVAGLCGPDRQMARVVLTTIQNEYSYSTKVTDPKQKPAFEGERYGQLSSYPDRADLWEEYVILRQRDKEQCLRDAPNATKFYRDNMEEMQKGCVVTNPHRFVSKNGKDGKPIELDAIQAFYNRVADWGWDAVLAEIQNAPKEQEKTEVMGLSAAKVISRVGQLPQGETPILAKCSVIGMDIGKHHSHWTRLAGEEDAVCSVTDYGVMETYGLSADSDNISVERAILASLQVFADDLKSSGNLPLLCLIDSGSYTNAVYEFCRQRGAPFFPSKGWDSVRHHMPHSNQTTVCFEEAYARFQPDEKVWLYQVNTEYWKEWTQQRFLVNPYDDIGGRVAGSMVLFDPGHDKKKHLAFAHHIVSEEKQTVPRAGKPPKVEWFQRSRNNHWLDATALASAALGCVGVRLIKPQPSPVRPAPAPPPEPRRQFLTPHGQPFLVTRRS